MFLEAFDIRHIEVEGSPKKDEDAHKVFKAEIWMEGNINYVFSFEGDFYSCQRTGWNKTGASEVVEEGTSSGLQNLSVESISDFCIEMAKLLELDRSTNENYEGINSVSAGEMHVYERIKRTEPVSEQDLREDLEEQSLVDMTQVGEILNHLIEIGLIQENSDGLEVT
jgi:hypothetical protein